MIDKPLCSLARIAAKLRWGLLVAGWLLVASAQATPLPTPLLDSDKAASAALQLLRIDASGARVSFQRGAGGPVWTFSLVDRVLQRGEDAVLPKAQLTRRVGPPTPQVLALYQARGGRLQVAARADGTLRWSVVESGQELAALLVHPDHQRWVAWTPSGYYDASVGGEELLGFYVPRGARETPDLFRVGLLRERLHRPAVLTRTLFTLDERRALEEVDAEAGHPSDHSPLTWPAVVRVLSPVDGASLTQAEVNLCVAVRAPAGEEQRLRATVSGGSQARGILVTAPTQGGCTPKPGETTHTLRLRVPREDVTVRVVAEGKATRSEPALLHLRWAGPKEPARTLKPNLHVLAVGVGSYQASGMALRYAAKDARDLSTTLQGLRDRPYGRVEQRLLTDEEAGRAQVLAGLSWLKQHAEERDVSVVFLAGHGINDEGGRYYFLPHDAAPAAGEPLQNPSLLSGERLQAALGEVPGRLVLFLDTCNSGSLRGPARGDLSRFRNELLSSGTDLVLYAAAGPGQASQESARWNNGAFTKALIEGLKGRADYREKGVVTVTALDTYLTERVRDLTRGEQVPTTTKVTATDFVLAQPGRSLALHRRWWFWGTLGLVTAGTIAGAVIGTSRPTVVF